MLCFVKFWRLDLLAVTFFAVACATLDPMKAVEKTWDEAYVRIPGMIPAVKEQRAKQLAKLRPGT